VVDVLRPIVSCDRSRLPHARIPHITATPLAAGAVDPLSARPSQNRRRSGGFRRRLWRPPRRAGAHFRAAARRLL